MTQFPVQLFPAAAARPGAFVAAVLIGLAIFMAVKPQGKATTQKNAM